MTYLKKYFWEATCWKCNVQIPDARICDKWVDGSFPVLCKECYDKLPDNEYFELTD